MLKHLLIPNNFIKKAFFITSTVIIFNLIILSAIMPTNVSASMTTGFNSGKIIDDNVFTDYSTMGVSQIQAFLDSKVPICNGVSPTCLRYYNENGKSSAQIIYDAAQTYKINPQVLIVLLQKEQGLVTSIKPASDNYRSATGYACGDTSACETQYYGFTNQIHWAATMFRAILNNSPTWHKPYVLGNNFIYYSPDFSCGGSVVNIQNRSTQALYNYTPYQPNQSSLNAEWGETPTCGAYGNRNFYLYFTAWFGSVTGSPLYKSSENNSIYYIVNNTKYHIASYDILNSFGLQKYNVTTVSDAYLDNFETGIDITSTVGKKAADPSGTIYMFDDGKRYPIDITACSKYPDGSLLVKTTWSLDCFNSNKTLSLPNELIDTYTKQDITLTDLILYNNTAWKIEGGKKLRITDPIFVDIFGGWGKARWMSSINVPVNDGKMLIPDNSTVKFNNSPVLYFLSNAELHPILGYGEYSAWAINKYPAYEFPAEYNNADPISVGLNLSFCAKDYSGQYYLLNLNGNKIRLNDNPNKWGYSNEECNQTTSAVLSRIVTIDDSGIYRSETGNIFTIDTSLKKLQFPTVGDIVYSGYNPNKIINLSKTVESKLSYSGLKLSPGRLFKISGSDTIQYVFNEEASLAVYSTNIPNLPYDKLITVDSLTGLRYPIIGVYK